MTKGFTGRHMAAILIAFFAVVLAVNVTMARFASDTFGGTVVENSYVASQQYNLWLERARMQQGLGWTPSIRADAGRHLTVSIATTNGPLREATVSAVATHPLGAQPSRSLTFVEDHGQYSSQEPLPAGRWLIRVRVAHGSDRASFDDQVGS